MLSQRMMMGAASGEGGEPSTDPSLVGYTAVTFTTTGDKTISVPEGTAEGDLLLLIIGVRQGTITSAQGWTHLAYTAVSTTSNVQLWSRRAPNSVPESYTVNVSAVSYGGACLLVAMHNVGDYQAIASLEDGDEFSSVAGTDGGAVIGLGSTINTTWQLTSVTGMTTIGTAEEADNAYSFAAWKLLAATESTGTFAINPSLPIYTLNVTVSYLPPPASTITPTFVGWAGGASPDTNTFTVDVPAGVQDGDLLVLATAHRNCDIADPAGWTERIGVDVSSNEWNHVFTRVASSEPASYTLDPGGGQSAAMIAAFRGVGDYQASTHSTSAPSAAAGTDGGIVVSVVHSSYDADYPIGLIGTEYIAMQTQGADAKVMMAWKPLLATENTGDFTLVATGGMSYDGYSTVTFSPPA